LLGGHDSATGRDHLQVAKFSEIAVERVYSYIITTEGRRSSCAVAD